MSYLKSPTQGMLAMPMPKLPGGRFGVLSGTGPGSDELDTVADLFGHVKARGGACSGPGHRCF